MYYVHVCTHIYIYTYVYLLMSFYGYRLYAHVKKRCTRCDIYIYAHTPVFMFAYVTVSRPSLIWPRKEHASWAEVISETSSVGKLTCGDKVPKLALLQPV